MIPKPNDIIGLWRHDREYGLEVRELISAVITSPEFLVAIKSVVPQLKWSTGQILCDGENLYYPDGQVIASNGYLAIDTYYGQFKDQVGSNGTANQILTFVGSSNTPIWMSLTNNEDYLLDSYRNPPARGTVLVGQGATALWTNLSSVLAATVVSHDNGNLSTSFGTTYIGSDITPSGEGIYQLNFYASFPSTFNFPIAFVIKWTDSVGSQSFNSGSLELGTNNLYHVTFPIKLNGTQKISLQYDQYASLNNPPGIYYLIITGPII